MAEYISKEAVMSKCNDIWDNADETTQTGVDTINTIDEITDFIESLPAADVQPVKQWMKLHEKHPDTEGFYLVCDQYGECEVAEYLPDIKSWFTHKVNGEIRYWMPLPEPPQD